VLQIFVCYGSPLLASKDLLLLILLVTTFLVGVRLLGAEESSNLLAGLTLFFRILVGRSHDGRDNQFWRRRFVLDKGTLLTYVVQDQG